MRRTEKYLTGQCYPVCKGLLSCMLLPCIFVFRQRNERNATLASLLILQLSLGNNAVQLFFSEDKKILCVLVLIAMVCCFFPRFYLLL